MDTTLHQNKTFENIDYSEQKINNSEFFKCEFINCNFSKSDLSYNDFMECSFKNCNFSLAVLQNTGLKDIIFVGCKMMGLDFTVCNNFLFSMSFQDCILDYSTFLQKKMKKTNFIDCSLQDADFSNADLTMALFKNCDLMSTVFAGTILEKADFRSAKNFSLDPSENKMKQAKFSHLQLAGLLEKFDLAIE
jgi:fluoroquinolone resistance protein